MKSLMSSYAKRILTGVIAFAASTGCAADITPPHDPSAASDAAAKQLVISTLPFDIACPRPSQVIAVGPGITVLTADRKGVPNMPVRFVVAGGGSVEHPTTVTDATGYASPGAWTLGPSTGTNSVTAYVTNAMPAKIELTSSTTSSKVIAAFALLSIGGQSLPLTYSGGGSTWTITAGHYFLAEDGTYDFGYDLGGATPIPTVSCFKARYVTHPSSIDFYLAAGSYPQSTFYADRLGLFSTATLTPDGATFSYQDTMDFETEVYQRIDVPSSAAAAMTKRQP